MEGFNRWLFIQSEGYKSDGNTQDYISNILVTWSNMIWPTKKTELSLGFNTLTANLANSLYNGKYCSPFWRVCN